MAMAHDRIVSIYSSHESLFKSVKEPSSYRTASVKNLLSARTISLLITSALRAFHPMPRSLIFFVLAKLNETHVTRLLLIVLSESSSVGVSTTVEDVVLVLVLLESLRVVLLNFFLDLRDAG